MWPNPQFPANLVTFTEQSLMENFIFRIVTWWEACHSNMNLVVLCSWQLQKAKENGLQPVTLNYFLQQPQGFISDDFSPVKKKKCAFLVFYNFSGNT